MADDEWTPRASASVEASDADVGSVPASSEAVREVKRLRAELNMVFEWHDGILVEAMQAGSTFLLLDERNIIASHNVQLKLGSVTKHPSNPLLREEKP